METVPLLLCTLTPDVLQAIVRRSCDGMHSEDDAAAASAQDTAMALRLTCRTLRATVDGDVKQLTMRATSSEDIKQASKLFPGVHAAYKTGCLHIDMSCHHQQPIPYTADGCICRGYLAGLQRVHLHVPRGTNTITIVQEQMPCLNDIRCAL